MKLNIIAEPPDAPVRFSGPLTIYHAEAARAALLSELARRSELVLDLAGVSACDAAGAQLLVAAKKSAASAGRRFCISTRGTAVDECFTRLGIDPEHSTHPS